MIRIKQFTLGQMGSNAYIIFDDQTKDAVLIDPGMETDDFYDYLKDNGLKLNKILLTHGHYDHIAGLGHLVEQTGAPVYVPKKDMEMISSSEKNLSGFLDGAKISFDLECKPLEDGDIIEITPEEKLEVIETPGHTPGSVCFRGFNYVVTGDTLFQGSIGRTDFPGSDPTAMKESLKKLIDLGDNFLILPGHGEISTIGDEKRTNIFILNPDIIDSI